MSHVGWIAAQDEAGKTLFSDFLQYIASNKLDISVVSSTIENANFPDPVDIEKVLQTMKSAKYRYFVVSGGSPEGLDIFMEKASEAGITGPGYQWITNAFDGAPKFISSEKQNLIAAYNGILSVALDVPSKPELKEAMTEMLQDPNRTSFYVELHREPFIYDDYDFSTVSTNIIPSFSALTYDAVMAMGIAACQAENRFFTGVEHYEQIKKLAFEGSTGFVHFDPNTGSRLPTDLRIRFINMYIPPFAAAGPPGTVMLLPSDAIAVDLANIANPIIIQSELRFADNSSNIPKDLPALNSIDENLIPDGARILGWCVCGICILWSVWCIIFTLIRRGEKTVRLSQPFFLGKCCEVFLKRRSLKPLKAHFVLCAIK